MRPTNVQPSPRSVHVPGDPSSILGKVLPAASLLAGAALEDLCLSFHASTGVGAVANPVGGSAQDASSGTAVLGALRGGGFVSARIDSSNPARVIRSQTDHILQWDKVRVLTAGEPVTSAHLNLPENGLRAPGGLGQRSAEHRPGADGDPRLHDLPQPAWEREVPHPQSDPFRRDWAHRRGHDQRQRHGRALPPADDARNYTVILAPGGTLLATTAATAAGSAGATAGDYWHVRVPWNSSGYGTADAPNGFSALFNTQITVWCTSCHVQHYSIVDYLPNPSGDTLYEYRHVTTGMLACTTCHVAYGSNARIEGQFSSTQPFPNGSAPLYSIGRTTGGDSRLLKVDNRGTCQLCHDPTHTVAPGTYTGPSATPGVP
jgi:hypothetical protein